MKAPPKNPAIRQGRFIWMDESTKKNYLSTLKKRIEEGYYFSDNVITRIVDEIAPVINDTIEHDGVMG